MGLIVECYSTGNKWGIGRFTRQTVFEFLDGSKRYTRASDVNKNYRGWHQDEGGGGGSIVYNNQYHYNTYSNSYDVTAMPEITSDTNNYLAPGTGDRWADITAMLQASGVCHLGPGDYYISQTLDVSTGVRDNLVPMTLTGCGNRTRLILMASAGNVPAINMQGLAVISDLCICGEENEATYITNYTAICTAADAQSVEPAPTERHGILWEGNAIDKASSGYPKRGTISNVMIKWFTGGGITARATGLNIDNCLNVVNCYIENCMVASSTGSPMSTRTIATSARKTTAETISSRPAASARTRSACGSATWPRTRRTTATAPSSAASLITCSRPGTTAWIPPCRTRAWRSTSTA